MRNGFSIIELVIAVILIGLLTLVTIPPVRATLDRLAVVRAGSEMVQFYREARSLAIRRATPVEIRIANDSLLALLRGTVALRRPGPAVHGVQLTVTRAEFLLGPSGLGLGPANTRLTLRRGAVLDAYVTSRLGRLRRAQ